jgi:hypothetical protein
MRAWKNVWKNVVGMRWGNMGSRWAVGGCGCSPVPSLNSHVPAGVGLVNDIFSLYARPPASY